MLLLSVNSTHDGVFACQVSMSGKQKDKADDHHADQNNPNSDAHKAKMDHQADQSNQTSSACKAATDNRTNQMNPMHPAYHASRQESPGGDASGYSQSGDKDDKK